MKNIDVKLFTHYMALCVLHYHSRCGPAAVPPGGGVIPSLHREIFSSFNERRVCRGALGVLAASLPLARGSDIPQKQSIDVAESSLVRRL